MSELSKKFLQEVEILERYEPFATDAIFDRWAKKSKISLPDFHYLARGENPVYWEERQRNDEYANEFFSETVAIVNEVGSCTENISPSAWVSHFRHCSIPMDEKWLAAIDRYHYPFPSSKPLVFRPKNEIPSLLEQYLNKQIYENKKTNDSKCIAISGDTFSRLNAAIEAFPAVYPEYRTKPPKLDGDVREWLVTQFDCEKNREAHVFGKIIAEHFGLK